MSEEQEAPGASDGRAYYNASVWLNSVFVVRRPRFRVFKRSAVRLSPADIVLIPLTALVVGVVVFFLFTPLTYIPGIQQLVSPWMLAIVFGVFGGWFGGRRLAKASPYRRTTGEGLGQYLVVQSGSKRYLLGRLIGRTVAINPYYTWATGKRLPVDCVEWLGTARVPNAPKRPGPDPEVDRIDLYLRPRSIPTNWVGNASTSARSRH